MDGESEHPRRRARSRGREPVLYRALSVSLSSFPRRESAAMSPAPPGAAFFELVRADPGRSLEAACDALVALPASLASCSGLSLPTLSTAVSSLLSESGAAQQAGPLDYMKEAANAVDPALAYHYLGRALEVQGVAETVWGAMRGADVEGGLFGRHARRRRPPRPCLTLNVDT